MIRCFIIFASSKEPMISMTKSSAYLRYIRRLKFGSNMFRLGISRLLIASSLIKGEPGLDFFNQAILDVRASYSLFLILFLPFSKFSFSESMYLSNSLSTILAKMGLIILP